MSDSDLYDVLMQYAGKQTADGGALRHAYEEVAVLKQQVADLAQSVTAARQVALDSEQLVQRERQSTAVEATSRQNAESRQAAAQHNLDAVLRDLDDVRQKRFDLEQLLQKVSLASLVLHDRRPRDLCPWFGPGSGFEWMTPCLSSLLNLCT